jgi:hypothetical protein
MQLLEDRIDGSVRLEIWQSVMYAVTKRSIRCTSCLTQVNQTRRMALLVLREKKRSIWLNQEL